MNAEVCVAATLPTDEERRLLRDSVRGFLEQHWPAAGAVARGSDAAQMSSIWQRLAGQGLLSLGTDPAEGGLREAVVVAQELGRAACAVPFIDAFLANRWLAQSSASDALAARPLAAVLDGVAGGRNCVCVSFGESDPDPGATALQVVSGGGAGAVATLTGHVDFVDGAICATHALIVVDAGSALAVVDLDAAGVNRTAMRAMGANGLFRIGFESAAASRVPIHGATLADALSVARLLYMARAWGAADRAFELVTAYVKDRKQFGQPVGRYQAVQHKLANNLIALTGVSLGLSNAAEHFDRGVEHWRTFSAALAAFANGALRQVALETHHAFGAIGYAEEHEAPRHFKRVHLDVTRFGGARTAREELAQRYLGETSCEFPEYDYGESSNAFRRKVRTWLAENWTEADRQAHEQRDRTHREFDREFATRLGKTGWVALTWPREHGGLEGSAFDLLGFMEEMNRAEAPRVGAPIQANSWMTYGTREQQQRYLPELARGEVIYGMWYSEPDSGSDLASIRTRAEKDGDEWVINGQKIWTTTYWGEYMWLAARTDPNAKPQHSGISMFVVRTDTPGITRRPMNTMYDGEFCNTFFDNVRVPADALVGEVNGGWKILTGSLGTERAYVGSSIIMKVARQFEELCDHVRTLERDGRPLRLDPIVRDTIGSYAAQIEIGRQLALNSVSIYARGAEPTWEAAMSKVFGGELMERFNESALDILGMTATLSGGSPGAPLGGRLEQKLRHSLMWVISIGTNEIQRSLIAQRGLGLPR